jgi:hypothetical protein
MELTCQPVLVDELPDLLHLVGLRLRAIGLKVHDVGDTRLSEDMVAAPDPLGEPEALEQLPQVVENRILASEVPRSTWNSVCWMLVTR